MPGKPNFELLHSRGISTVFAMLVFFFPHGLVAFVSGWNPRATVCRPASWVSYIFTCRAVKRGFDVRRRDKANRIRGVKVHLCVCLLSE